MSDCLQPHEPQHARLPCPSLSPGVWSNLCPFSRWCHPSHPRLYCIPIGQRHFGPHWISWITSAKWQSSWYYSLDQLWTISFSKLRVESPMESDGNVLYKSKVHKHGTWFLVIGLARYNNLLFILEIEPYMSSIIRPFPPPLPKIHCPKSSVVFWDLCLTLWCKLSNPIILRICCFSFLDSINLMSFGQLRSLQTQLWHKTREVT